MSLAQPSANIRQVCKRVEDIGDVHSSRAPSMALPVPVSLIHLKDAAVSCVSQADHEATPDIGVPAKRLRSVADISLGEKENLLLLFAHYSDIVELAEAGLEHGPSGGFGGAWLLKMEMDDLLRTAPLTNYQRRVFTLHAHRGLSVARISRSVSTSEGRVAEIIDECAALMAKKASAEGQEGHAKKQTEKTGEVQDD